MMNEKLAEARYRSVSKVGHINMVNCFILVFLLLHFSFELGFLQISDLRASSYVDSLLCSKS